MSQQIAHYKSQNPHEATIQIKLCSFPELKAMDFGLDCIDILHYGQLLNAGYRKAREMTRVSKPPDLFNFSPGEYSPKFRS